MTGAIVLRRGAGFFVALDAALIVVVEVGGGDESGLLVSALGELIDVEGGLGAADEDVLALEAVEIFEGTLIDLIIVGREVRRQLQFRAHDAEKAVGIAVGDLAGFVHVDHVIGRTGDAGGEFNGWTGGVEGFDSHSSRSRGISDPSA